MESPLGIAARLLALFTLLTGVVYPLAITAVAQALFPEQANGSLITTGGVVVGSTLIAQPFDDPRYFWGRPSAIAAGPSAAQDATGSNLGPSSPALREAIRTRVEVLRAADEAVRAPVPIDLVTASASGIDPHISPAAAMFQVHRVARARGLDDALVRSLVEAHVEGRTFGVLGEPRVNVLLLDLALDKLDPKGK